MGKSKGKGIGKGNNYNPMVGRDWAGVVESEESKGDNAKFLRYAMVSLDLPPIDISDPKQVEKRIREYFDFCVENDRKPNIKGMGNWLGVDKTTVNSWKRGEYRSATHTPIIQRAIDVLEELWVDFMQNGKINPASGIFLGKNLFGYKDVQDVVVSPKNPLGDSEQAARLAERYIDAIEGDDVKQIEVDETATVESFKRSGERSEEQSEAQSLSGVVADEDDE